LNHLVEFTSTRTHVFPLSFVCKPHNIISKRILKKKHC